MATKNNIRSIRFSDDLAELIDQQVGDTFTQKFENLITRCVYELPKKEAELKRIQKEIDRERKTLQELHRSVGDWQRTIQNITPRIMALEAAFDRELDIRGK